MVDLETGRPPYQEKTMSLASALSDLRAEVVNGAAAADVVAEIAAEYGLNPVLLSRKFAESYRSEDALRATAQATDATVCTADRVARTVAGICKRYAVPLDATKVRSWRGKPYTYICTIAGSSKRPYLAVCHEDARAYRLPVH
jgi:hypothetical protein